MNLVSDCNGLTQDVSKDEWELRSSETPNESKREISMLRSCFEKGKYSLSTIITSENLGVDPI